jgi:hypothetical protein
MRVYDLANNDLILRSPPQGDVSKEGPHRNCPSRLFSICDNPGA